MKRLVNAVLTILVITCLGSCNELSKKAADDEIGDPKSEIAVTASDAVLRHVVLFKFKDDTDSAAIKNAEEAFLALPNKIPEILAFEWGINNSPEGLNKGLTHCYLLTFATEEDRAVYLPHPDHIAFGKTLDGILEDVTVIDYWVK